MDSTVDLKEVQKCVDKAKLDLMLGHKTTFFSALLANLKIIITTDIPTAATNGIYMKFNPDFVLSLTRKKLLGLTLHETLHVVFDHCAHVMDHLNQKILNIAQDHYINLFILALGYELPDNGHADPKFKDMSSMQIYNELMKDPPDTSGYTCDALQGDSGTDPADHAEDVTTNIIKAVQQAELAGDPGSIPGELLRRLDDVLNPKLPWEVILASYMDKYAKCEYSFQRPNRKHMPDFYLPTMYSEQLGQVTDGIDVSASMTDDDISSIHCEIKYMWQTMQPTSMRLMTFDTRVHLNKMYQEGEEIDDVELKGGGGTNVQPLLDSIKDENPAFALIFTDGYFATPNMDGITSDIFWIIKGNPGFTAPMGVVIPFD
jgi:predicted metal-dependent peptidase